MASKVLAGRYELFEKIGEGGMSVVYKAKDRLLNRYVAIKILKPEFIKDRKFIESFRRESQAAASLSHSNIVNIFDVGQEGNIHYIVMELVTGNTLSEMIKEEGPLPYQRVIELTKQIAAALREAHRNHLIHRDVKPHNVMLTADGTAKITDFGIAKAINSSTIADTLNGGIMGSVHYFSPEQARGGYVDEKSDIYSLGIVMYEMLTGRVPFDGDNPVNIALMHINSEMVPPSKLVSGIPPALERIVQKATDKYQSNRFGSVDEMIQALDQLEFVSGVIGNSVFAGSEDPDMDPILENDMEDYEDEPRKKKEKKDGGDGKKKKIIIAAAAAALVLIGILVALFAGGDPIIVPDLRGMPLEEAIELADEVGFKVEEGDYVSDSEVPEGCVVSQTPKANGTAKKGATIRVNLSKGPGNGQVPDLEGKTEKEAEELLEANGFKLGDVTPGPSDLEEGKVFDQYPSAGTTLKEGSTVSIKVSDGSKAKVEVPYLVGKDIDDAKSLLIDNDLKPGDISYESSSTYDVNEVIWQEYGAGEEIEKDTAVKLTVSTGPQNSKSVDLFIDYSAADNDVFFMTVTISDEAGTRNVIANQQRNKADDGENITLDGEGSGTVVVVFDGKQVIKKNVDFTKGTIN
jgi:serine/threonine-protein kinase